MDKYLKFIISSSKLVIFGLLVVLAISSNGINNFKLDASSDALVIEGDASLKKFREAEKEFGGSDFLIVVIDSLWSFSEKQRTQITNKLKSENQ